MTKQHCKKSMIKHRKKSKSMTKAQKKKNREEFIEKFEAARTMLSLKKRPTIDLTLSMGRKRSKSCNYKCKCKSRFGCCI